MTEKEEKKNNEWIGQIEDNSKMTDLYLTIIVITLNVNGVNTPVKSRDSQIV